MRQSLLTILLIPILLFMGALGRLPVERALGALGYPYQLDNVEGYLLDEAVQLSRGRNVYAAIDEPPYLVANYPPLYQLLYAVFVDAAGPSLVFGRMICLSSLLGIALALMLICLRIGKQILPALLCPALFVATYECHNWAAYARVDLPALFLSFLGLTCFLAEASKAARRMAIVFFVLAAMTKQTTLAAPLACGLFLALSDRRQGARFVLAFVLWVGALTLLLGALTKGQYLRHTILYNTNAMHWAQLRQVWLPHLDRFYHYYLIGLILAFAFVSYRLIRPFRMPLRPESEAPEAQPDGPSHLPTEPEVEGPPTSSAAADDRVNQDAGAGEAPAPAEEPSAKSPASDFSTSQRLGLLAIYFVLAGLSIVTLAKAGSAENYLLEPLAAAALFFSCALGRALWESANGRRAWAATFFAALMLASAGLHCHWIYRHNGFVARLMFSRAVPTASQRDQADRLFLTVRQANGEVLCEDPIFVVLDGRRPPINPFILSQLAREGKWDESPFVAQIERRGFVLVVTTADINGGKIQERYTPRMVEALKRQYEIYETYDLGRDGQTYYVYRPRAGLTPHFDIARTTGQAPSV